MTEHKNTEQNRSTYRKERWNRLRFRLFKMVSVGVVDEPVNQGYDVISSSALILNLVVSVMSTFEEFSAYQGLLKQVENITVLFFAIDFVLRVITARDLYPKKSRSAAIRSYVLSFDGIIDWLSFVPYYLPMFFPSGAAAFRMFRVARILRLFRINAYYDSLNAISDVIKSKKQQLLSSVFVIMVMMLGSSLCMYSLEHQAQPDVFKNAFSGIWWATSTLLTVGYGDIYPITPWGKLFGICITFLGVGLVAIPTGIISAGFVEQYQRIQKISSVGTVEDIDFIRVRIRQGDSWVGRRIRDLALPQEALIVLIQRGRETVIPRGDIQLKAGDEVFLGAETFGKDTQTVHLSEITLKRDHPWNGVAIRDLDISRQTFLVAVKRKEAVILPKGNLILAEGDEVILYSKVPVQLPGIQEDFRK